MLTFPTVVVPIRTYSELNESTHWRTRSKRTKAQREAAYYSMRQQIGGAMNCRTPATITITRVGPYNRMDTDNLHAALKHIRDGVADWLGLDDGSPLLTWKSEQRRNPVWSIEIAIEFGEPDRT
jgi:hypothetical protein